MSTVLVTGGSGFIGSHIILQLLDAGYTVRATVRHLSREPQVRALLREGGATEESQLTFVAANLEEDRGWSDAARGCDFVLHVASPFPTRLPRHEDELIVPAREGTLRVLRAAREAGVRRVVLTSSFAAVGYGHPPQRAPFDESSWTDVEGPNVSPYVKSKTLAERAAWDFVAREGGSLELAVINPVMVFGPVLGTDYSTSIGVIQQMLDGKFPAFPRIAFGVIDVRDVASLHLRAMMHPAAYGERFLAVAGDFVTLREIGRVLRSRLGDAARRVPTLELPDWVVRGAALFDPALGQVVPELGPPKNATSAKARRVLDWRPRPTAEAIVSTAQSLIRRGLVQAKANAGR